MTIKNAIKKIEKITGIKVKKVNDIFIAVKNGRELSFIKNGGDSNEAICFRTRGLNDNDDILSDYCAGVFWDNATQGANALNRQQFYMLDNKRKLLSSYKIVRLLINC